MPRKLIKRFTPNSDSLKTHPALKWLGGWLHSANLWHLNRNSVASAFFVGIFCAMLPAPFQMFIAASLAILFKANIPISVSLVWTTNPITIPPIFFFAYQVGTYLLDMPAREPEVEMSLTWLKEELSIAWKPLVVGCLVCGITLASICYCTIQIVWRWHVIHNWQKRKAARVSSSKS